MKSLYGALTAMVTPFDKSGALQLEAIEPFLRFQEAAGIDGVVVSGTNGEGPSLSVSERKRLLEEVIRHRRDLPVVAGTGAASVSDAIELTEHAGSVGADAVLVLPPFYFKNASADGLAAYFRMVMDSSTVPVLLYNIPQHSSVEISDEILDRLEGQPELLGIKDSAGAWERTAELIRSRPGLKIFPGGDRLLARALEAGAAGSISGTANAFPELVAGVWQMFRSGGDVNAAQSRLDAAIAILSQYPVAAANKSVLAHRGMGRMWVRPPLVDLSGPQETEMLGRLQDAGLL
ncbi:MAG: dihydrodipicolinate synthase family protein [Chloroflexi bacterium]|nr:dihydrodipicolinate synthase family protein [Chloroflexota bacterium]